MCKFEKYVNEEYVRKGITEIKEWQGEDITGVSVSPFDKKNGSPKKGDRIARNPTDYDDKWLVAEKYFHEKYEKV